MKHGTFILSIIAACTLFLACEDLFGGKDEETEALALAFTFSPAILDEESALEGMVAGEFKADGTVTLEEGAGDNGKFTIDGSELIIEEDLTGGPYTVQFRIEGPEGAAFTHSEIVFVSFAGGPTDFSFTPVYQLMAGTAAARGLCPIGTFLSEGGIAPYNYSLVTGTEENSAGNASFRGGAEGLYARSALEVNEYQIYVRVTDGNGKFFQKGITVNVTEHSSPTFTEDEDYVRFPETIVNGSQSYGSPIFTDGRNLTIPPFMLAKYHVTRVVFWDVYQWAIKAGDYSSREGTAYIFNNSNSLLPTSAPVKADEVKPQVRLRWINAVLWLNAFSEKEGLTPVYYSDDSFISVLRSNTNVYTKWDADGYRLPCGAEWEFAARGGVPSAETGSPWMYHYIGTDNYSEINMYLWTSTSYAPGALAPIGDGTNSDKRQPAGLLLPNTAGLYDMNGDWGSDSFPNNIVESVISQNTPLRGANGENGTYHITLSSISGNSITTSNGYAYAIGFRIARTVSAGE